MCLWKPAASNTSLVSFIVDLFTGLSWVAAVVVSSLESHMTGISIIIIIIVIIFIIIKSHDIFPIIGYYPLWLTINSPSDHHHHHHHGSYHPHHRHSAILAILAHNLHPAPPLVSCHHIVLAGDKMASLSMTNSFHPLWWQALQHPPLPRRLPWSFMSSILVLIRSSISQNPDYLRLLADDSASLAHHFLSICQQAVGRTPGELAEHWWGRSISSRTNDALGKAIRGLRRTFQTRSWFFLAAIVPATSGDIHRWPWGIEKESPGDPCLTMVLGHSWSFHFG